MNITQILNVARREYLARVRNKWFVIGTLLVPAIFALWAVVPTLLDRADVEELRLSLVDVETGAASAVLERLEAIDDFPLVVHERITLGADELEAVRAALREPVLDDTIDGYVVLELDAEGRLQGRYYARETGNLVITEALEDAIRTTALESYLAGTGVDSQRVTELVGWDLDAVQISAEGEEEGGFLRAYFTAFGFAMLIYMTVLVGGQQLGTSIVEEKSSRLIELVLGAVSSSEFMAGKILGNVGASLTQLAVWISLALLGGLYVFPVLLAADVDMMAVLQPVRLFYFALFYVLGFLFYATVFAMVAATCTNLEEFQQAATPVTMTVVVSLMFIFYAITNPSTLATRILSFVPPVTPLIMVARINVLMPPHWEVLATAGFLLLASLAVMWIAGKVFRFALLMQGKRPAFGTIVRLMRAA